MFLSFVASTLLLAAPIPSTAKLSDPIATLHFAPIEVLEKDFFRFLQSMPIPNKEQTIQEMRDKLKATLGESGWDGLDVKKPGTGYLVFDEKNPDKSYGFIVAPVTDEKTFIDLFTRIGKAGDAGNHLEEVKGSPGLFKLVGKKNDVPMHLRVYKNYAYLGINAPIDAFAADKLIPAEKTLNPKETAKIAVTVLASQLPKEWTQKGVEDFQRWAREDIAKHGGSAEIRNFMNRAIDLVPKYATQLQSEGETFGFRLRYDESPKYELFLKAKPGTTLAKDIAARKPTTNRFGGIINDKTVAGVHLKLPFLNDDLRALSSKGLEEYYKEMCEKDPPPADAKPLLDLLVPRLSTTIKSGDFDLAASLNGPDAKSTYTVVAGIALDDAVGITPELKKAIDKLAEGVVEWDANESDGMKIHNLNLVPLLPGELKKVFGNNATCHFSLTKSGVFFSLGRDALPEIKRAMALKPSNASVLDVKINAAKLTKLIEETNGQLNGMMGAVLGKDDKVKSVYSLNVSGGAELIINFDLGASIFSTAFFLGTSASGTFLTQP